MNITELAQSLKAAAEKATPGRIGDRIDGSGSIKYQCFGNDGSLVLQTDHKNMEYGFIGPNAEADELFFRECAPANILALVEALEKAQQVDEELCKLLPLGAEYMDPPDGGDVTPLEGVRRMVADYRQRIAELESRTVKLPPKVDSSNIPFAGHTWNCCLDEVEKRLAAVGIKVETE
ncbi:TPA: ead/Ea22-like family protein [Klebsiella aerogenes]|nr:ead/Ea22-like family protein [Klebsiella aerogenes]